MNKTLSNAIKLTLSFVIAGVFSYFIFRGIDTEALKKSILSADYRWIILCAIMAYASVLSRAIGWRMLLNTMGHKVSNTQAYHAIAINYIANIALPRFGEVARCIAVKRTNNVPVSESVGTVLVERLIDLILLALITSVAILFI